MSETRILESEPLGREAGAGAKAAEPRREEARGPAKAGVAGPGLSQEELGRLSEAIVAALKTVYDPEIPADIYELGLIYKIDISAERDVTIEMTLTAPGCPVAGDMPRWVEDAVGAVPGVRSASVRLTFDPPWDQSRMSDEARMALGMF